MSDIRRFDSDGLADATTVTTSTAGPDDNVFNVVNGSVAIDTSGPRSPRMFLDQSVQLDTSVHWYGLGSLAAIGFRFEFEVGGTAGASNTLVVGSTTGGAGASFRLDLTGGLKLRIRNDAGTPQGSDSTTILSASTLYRIEGVVTATQMDVWIFPSESSTSALEQMTRASTYGNIDQLRFGPTIGSGGGGGGFTGGMYFDSIIVTDSATPPGPWYAAAADPVVVGCWPGIPGETTVSAGYILQNTTNAALVASANPDLSAPVEGTPVAVSADGWVTATVGTLTADTLYYFGVKLDGTLSADGRFTARTAPTAGTRRSFSFLFGSCQNTGSNHAVFDEMASEAAAFLIHMGDLHYEDATTETVWRDGMESSLTAAKFQDMLAVTPMTYAWDNHDWGGDNSHAGSPVAGFAPDVIRELDPNQRAEPVGLQSTWVHGRVRFILLDTRAYRDPSTDPAAPSKTMLGTVQKAWLKSTLEAADEPLIFIASCIPWRASGIDRWGSYNDEWREIRDWIDDRPALKKRLYAVFGDIHALAADDGTNGAGSDPAATTNIPHACGAAFNSGGVSTTESWTHGYHANDVGRGQYGLITVTDEAPDPIVVHFEGKQDDGDVLVEMTTTFTTGLARYRLDGGALVQDVRRYVASGSYPKTATLVETFGTQDVDVWEGWGTGVAVVSGKLAVNYLQAGPVLQTKTPFDLAESSVFARVVHTAGTSNEPYMMFGDPGGIFVGNQIQFVLNGTTLFLRELVAGAPNDTTVAYDDVAMAWWRIRHAGSDVFWDTSPDGTTWTNRRTKTATFTLTSGRVKFGAFNFAANQATAATFDNVNNA